MARPKGFTLMQAGLNQLGPRIEGSYLNFERVLEFRRSQSKAKHSWVINDKAAQSTRLRKVKVTLSKLKFMED